MAPRLCLRAQANRRLDAGNQKWSGESGAHGSHLGIFTIFESSSHDIRHQNTRDTYTCGCAAQA